MLKEALFSLCFVQAFASEQSLPVQISKLSLEQLYYSVFLTQESKLS